MYDRGKRRPPLLRSSGFQYRLETLIGVTGYKLAKYRASWWDVSTACLDVVWRPQFLLVVLFEVSLVKTNVRMYSNVFVLRWPSLASVLD